MKNLKRALSLVLATVMVIGMMVVGASAASYNDFTDKDEINNVEAVALLNDLGIIEGYNNTYAPNATIDRAGMAKLVTKIMMGDVDPAIFEGTVTNLTDIDGHWAEGYIKYCYSNGIISGYDGKFAPNEPIDVVGAAKVLLTALGYNAERQGYVGSTNWSVNVMKDANSTREDVTNDVRPLTQGVVAKATDPLTRENAAQMIFNALFVETVVPEYQYDMGNQYITKYTAGASLASTLYSNPVRLTGVVTSIGDDGNAVLTVGDDLGYTDAQTDVNDAKLAVSAEMVGETVSFYVLPTGAATSDLLSSALAPAGTNTLYTLTGAYKDTEGTTAIQKLVDDKVIKLDTGKTIDSNPSTDLAYYHNGADGAGEKAKVGKNGVEVKFIDTTADGKVDAVVITEKTADIVTAAPVVTTSKGKELVTIAGLGIVNVETKNVIGYEGLAKDDVVLTIKLGSKWYIEKAQSFNGTVTGYSSSKAADLINGKYYQASELMGLGGAAYSVNAISDAKERTFYLDNFGYIVYSEIVTGKAAVANYAAVAEIVWVRPNGDGSIGSAKDSYAQAKLVFTDGTTKVVKVGSIDGFKFVEAAALNTLVADGDYCKSGKTPTTAVTVDATDATPGTLYTFYGEDTFTTVKGKVATVNARIAGNNAGLNTLVPANNFYAYTVDKDGVYALSTDALTNNGWGDMADHVITNNTVKFDDTNVANAKTVFIYATKDADGNDVYTVYTGIENVPTTSASATNNAQPRTIVTDKQGYALYVFAVVGGTESDSKDVVYITDGEHTTVNGETYVMQDAIVNGEPATIKVDDAYSTAGFYTVDKVVDGVYYLIDDSSSVDTGIKGNGGNVLVTNNGADSYAYADGTIAYVINSDNEVTTTTVDTLALDATDLVYVVKVNTDVVAVYVVEVDAQPSTLTASVTGASLKDSKDNIYEGVTVVGVAGNTVDVDTASDAGMTYTYTIKGAGTATENGAYTLVAGDLTAGSITVIVTATDDYNDAVYAYTYTIAVEAAG